MKLFDALKRIIPFLLMLSMASIGEAQFVIPRSFTVFTHLLAADVNLDFTTLGDALNRTGGTITGTIAISDGNTIDGVDISTYLANGKLTAQSTAADAVKVGGGITAAGNAIVDTTGKVPALSSTYFASLSAANLTALPAANLTGTITTATQDLITRTGTVVSGTWSSLFGSVSGANLTSLNAANFSTGTVPPARLGSGTPDIGTLLRGDGVWTTIAGTSVPSNLLIFSASGACPSGFSEYTAARGRAILGLPASGTNAGTVGTGLSNLENRTSTHSIPTLVIQNVTATTSTDGSHTHSGTTSGPNGTTGSDNTDPSFSAGSSNHTHSYTTDANGAHSHSTTFNAGNTNANTSGIALTSDSVSYIQLMLCQKS